MIHGCSSSNRYYSQSVSYVCVTIQFELGLFYTILQFGRSNLDNQSFYMYCPKTERGEPHHTRQVGVSGRNPQF